MYRSIEWNTWLVNAGCIIDNYLTSGETCRVVIQVDARCLSRTEGNGQERKD